MPDFEWPVDKGLNTSEDEKRLPRGFLTEVRGFYYDQDDRDELHKLKGRTVAGDISTTTNVRNGFHLQYDGGNDTIVVGANSLIKEATAATSGMTFTNATDAAASPYAISGSFFKAITDGKNRWLTFDGATGSRPLVRDLDGNWRRLGLKNPDAPTASALTGVASKTSPDDARTVADAGGGFSNPTNATDDDLDTRASTSSASATTVTSTWKFEDNSVTADDKTLFVKVGSSSLLPIGSDGGLPEGEDFNATLKVEVTVDGGSNYTTIYSNSLPILDTTIQYDLASVTDDDIKNVWVKVTFTYTSGTILASAFVYEIWAQDDSAGGATQITGGTYTYAVTEVYQKTLSDGSVIEVESAPSDLVSITIDDTGGATETGIQLTLPSRTNLDADGTASTELIRRIYRTTSTGAWPNLGFIGETTIGATTYNDNFDVAGTTLGSPTINVVRIATAAYEANQPPPALHDATLYRGAVVGIPASSKRRLQWSLAGQPEYWPVTVHDLTLLPSDRNDGLQGVVAVGDVLVIFARTRVFRMTSLPFADQVNFDLSRLSIDILSAREGLAGSPLSYTLFQSQKGHTMVAWVSDNGIWMSDGSLVSERGLGTVKMTSNLDWDATVNQDNLSTSTLTYDPEQQIIWFNYDDPNGNRRALAFHVSPIHWVQSGQDQMVPKITGPHLIQVQNMFIGELSSRIKMWSVATTGKVWNERTGTKDNALWYDSNGDIESFFATGYDYLNGPRGEFTVYWFSLYHSNWGLSESCDLEQRFRRDRSGALQRVHKRGISLSGSRVARRFIGRGGQATQVTLRHVGQATGSLGPMAFEAEDMGETERE